MDDERTVDVVTYYHHPHKAHLLHHAVLPALRSVRAAGLDAHVQRHWQHGPHVRLRLRGDPAMVTARADIAAAGVRRYLGEHPSTAAQDPADLLARAPARGRAELVPGPYAPIHPDNTVRLESVDDSGLRGLLGGAEALRCREQLLAAGAAPVTAAVAHLVDDDTANRRTWLALRAMALHARSYPPGWALGAQSFRSHLEDFLHLDDPHGRVQDRFERIWRGCADAAVERVTADVGGTPADPVGRAFAGWSDTARSICGPAQRRGELPLPGSRYGRAAQALGDASTVDRWNGRRQTGYSAYHRTVLAADFDNAAGVAEHFGAYRFATNVLYLLLALCDITPVERYLAAHLLTRVTQRLTCPVPPRTPCPGGGPDEQ